MSEPLNVNKHLNKSSSLKFELSEEPHKIFLRFFDEEIIRSIAKFTFSKCTLAQDEGPELTPDKIAERRIKRYIAVLILMSILKTSNVENY